MPLLEFISQLANTNNLAIVGLSALLGKIWANRIAAKEDGIIKADLIRLQSELNSKNDAVSKTINHQSDLIKHAIQGSNGEGVLLFEKQCAAVCDLWKQFAKIRDDSGQLFTFHQLLTGKEKADPKTFASATLKPLTIGQVEVIIKNIMATQKESTNIRPLIPAQIFNLFSALVTFYARLGVHQLTNKTPNTVPCWYGDAKNPDYGVKQIIQIASDLKMSLPPLADDPMTFSKWKNTVEERLIEDILKFFNGSLDRKIEAYKQLELVTDLQVEITK